MELTKNEVQVLKLLLPEPPGAKSDMIKLHHFTSKIKA
jgi:hypothetical protein